MCMCMERGHVCLNVWLRESEYMCVQACVHVFFFFLVRGNLITSHALGAQMSQRMAGTRNIPRLITEKMAKKILRIVPSICEYMCQCMFVFCGLNRGLHSRDVMVSPTFSRPCSVAVRKQTFSPALFPSLTALSLISLVHPKLIELQFPHIPSAPLLVASACLTEVTMRPSLDCSIHRHNGFATLNERQHMKDRNDT